jgi:hypothetical protein
MYSFCGYFCCFSFRFVLPLLKNPFPSSIECILSADTSAMGTHSVFFFFFFFRCNKMAKNFNSCDDKM